MSYEEEIKAYKDYLIRKRKRPETIKVYTRQVKHFLKLIKKQPKNISHDEIYFGEKVVVGYELYSRINIENYRFLTEVKIDEVITMYFCDSEIARLATEDEVLANEI